MGDWCESVSARGRRQGRAISYETEEAGAERVDGDDIVMVQAWGQGHDPYLSWEPKAVTTWPSSCLRTWAT